MALENSFEAFGEVGIAHLVAVARPSDRLSDLRDVRGYCVDLLGYVVSNETCGHCVVDPGRPSPALETFFPTSASLIIDDVTLVCSARACSISVLTNMDPTYRPWLCLVDTTSWNRSPADRRSDRDNRQVSSGCPRWLWAGADEDDKASLWLSYSDRRHRCTGAAVPV